MADVIWHLTFEPAVVSDAPIFASFKRSLLFAVLHVIAIAHSFIAVDAIVACPEVLGHLAIEIFFLGFVELLFEKLVDVIDILAIEKLL